MPEIEKPFRKTGEAAISESPLHPRRKSHRIMVGPVPVGGGSANLGAIHDQYADSQCSRDIAADRGTDRSRLRYRARGRTKPG